MDLSTILNELPEDYFVFHEIVPTLQDIASFTVALTLRYDILHRTKSNNELDSDEDVLDVVLSPEIMASETERTMEHINIPQSIKNLINEKCKTINNKMSNWACDIRWDVFDNNFGHVKPSHLECIVWQFNGEIDCERTARKFISDSGLTEVNKFNIMCKFCWENDINGLVPDAELQQFFKSISRDGMDSWFRNPLVYYWTCKLNNELHRITINEEFSLEINMLGHVYSLSAVEYFWNFLNEPDQVTGATELLRNNYFMKDKQKTVFAKLNDFQKRSVIAAIPFDIIENFISNSDFEAARLVWNGMKNFISDDQFSASINRISRTLDEENFFFAIELWNTANEHHKNHFVYACRNVIIKLFFDREFKYECHRDYRLSFLSTILSYSSSGYRKNIILDHGDILFVEYRNCSKVNEIIEFCLPNSDDIAQFKERLRRSKEIQEYYNRCVSGGCFEILIEYLESYVRYESVLKDHVRQILSNFYCFRDSKVFIFRTWSDVKKLLNIVYGTDTSSIVEIKNKFIFSHRGEHHFYPPNFVNVRDFRNALQDLFDDMAALNEKSSVE